MLTVLEAMTHGSRYDKISQRLTSIHMNIFQKIDMLEDQQDIKMQQTRYCKRPRSAENRGACKPFKPHLVAISRDYNNDTAGTYGQESVSEQLERHRQFFDNRPLMRCLDKREDESFAEILYKRLLKETKDFAIYDIPKGYRAYSQVRSYWADIRANLKIREDIDEREWKGFERVELAG